MQEDIAQLNVKRLAGLPLQEFFEELKTSENGLKSDEARERLRIYGQNVIPANRWETLKIFAQEAVNPFNIILLVAALVSFVTGSPIEGGMIFLFFAMFVCVSFVEVYKANRAAQALKRYLTERVEVKRDGKLVVLDSRDIVKGDVVHLVPGDKVPADLRLISGEGLLIDESNLTGESQPIPKGATESQLRTGARAGTLKRGVALKQDLLLLSNILYDGTLVVQGFAEGVVVSTGSGSVFGSIAERTLQERHTSVFQTVLERFSMGVGTVAALGVGLVFVFDLILKQMPARELAIFSVVLGVSVVPEILPSITAISFAFASSRLAKKKMIVKRLSAVEDLGNIDVICVDKTGTLTENKLSLKEVQPEDPDTFLLFNVLAYPYQRKYAELSQYSFEAALYAEGKQFQKEKQKAKIITRVPFDPNTRTIQTTFAYEGKTYRLTSGAPENVLPECGFYATRSGLKRMTPKHAKELRDAFAAQTREGYRIFASAYTETGENQRRKPQTAFLGIASFVDPLKLKTKETIAKARELNLQIKILTGDSAEVAEHVAREIGLIAEHERVVGLTELKAMSRSEFRKTVEECAVFARVTPEWKHEIVKALQERHFVGFLGEGINDALVLKTANVAIALDRGADVSKEASDIIIFDKDLDTIVEGIIEGRKTFVNVNKYIKHTMSGNFGNYYAIALLSLVSRFLPLTAVQILLTNLMTDLPLMVVDQDAVDKELIAKPLNPSMKDLMFLLVGLGVVAGFFNVFTFALVQNMAPAVAQASLFLETTLLGLVVFYSIRTRRFFWQSAPSRLFSGLILGTCALAFLLVYGPWGALLGFGRPPLAVVAVILAATGLFMVTNDIVKKALLRFLKDLP